MFIIIIINYSNMFIIIIITINYWHAQWYATNNQSKSKSIYLILNLLLGHIAMHSIKWAYC